LYLRPKAMNSRLWFMRLEEKVEISLLIIKYAIEKYARIFAACSFGKDSRVIVDLGMQVKPDLKFIGIDTGYEFKETLSFAEQLLEETKMNFQWAKPSEKDRENIKKEYGGSFIKDSQYKCCAMKVPAIKPFLKTHDAWISGLRRDEAESRKNTKIIEEGKIIKINPIAFWTKDDVWQYIKENNLIYHPLYNQGYSSLGCKPCTSKSEVFVAGSQLKQSERSGRFINTDQEGKECGLHLISK